MFLICRDGLVWVDISLSFPRPLSLETSELDALDVLLDERKAGLSHRYRRRQAAGRSLLVTPVSPVSD